jgi:hypothetical protein
MQDHFSEHYEWDENGIPRRKKRVAGDGEQIHFPVTVMDHAASLFRPFFADGKPDYTSPHRKGFRFADTNDPGRIAANDAYEAMRERLSRKPQADARVPTLDELEQAAVTAYEERSTRMRDSWKTRHA